MNKLIIPVVVICIAAQSFAQEIRFENVSKSAKMEMQSRTTSPDASLSKGEWPPGDKTDAAYYAWPFDVDFLDINGDGHLDLFMLNHANGIWSRLWLGDGRGQWMMVDPMKLEPPARVAGESKSRGSFSLLPYNFGGDAQDLIVADGDLMASQLHFTGDIGKRDAEKFAWNKTPFPSATYTFLLADFNGDGKLDAAVGANRGATGKIMFGNGELWLKDFKNGPETFVGFHSVAADMNGDGFVDIVASDFGETKAKTEFYIGLLLNDGKGNFTDASADSGLEAAPAGGNIIVADFNNDGLMDIFLCGYPSTKKPDGAVKLYLNQGNGKFKDATEGSGLEGPKSVWTTRYVKCTAADFDNDGLVDIVSYGSGGYHVYQNLGDGKFKEITKSAGIPSDATGEPCAAAADFDVDGLIDLATINNGVWLGHNITQTKNVWLDVQLHGPAGNPEAAGASVTIYSVGHLGEKAFILGHQQAIFSTDFHTTGSCLHFGLGTHDSCDVRASFPGGKIVEMKDVKGRQRVAVKEKE